MLQCVQANACVRAALRSEGGQAAQHKAAAKVAVYECRASLPFLHAHAGSKGR